MRLTKGAARLGKVGKVDSKLGANTVVRSSGGDGANNVAVELGSGKEGLGGELAGISDSLGVVFDNLGVFGGDIADEGHRDEGEKSLGVHVGGCRSCESRLDWVAGYRCREDGLR